jgi:hypothetical protein
MPMVQIEYSRARRTASEAPTKRTRKSQMLAAKISRKSRNETATYGSALPARMSPRLAGEQ